MILFFLILFFVSFILIITMVSLKAYYLKSKPTTVRHTNHWFGIDLQHTQKKTKEFHRGTFRPFMKKVIMRLLRTYQSWVQWTRRRMRNLIQRIVRHYDDQPTTPSEQSAFLSEIKQHTEEVKSQKTFTE